MSTDHPTASAATGIIGSRGPWQLVLGLITLTDLGGDAYQAFMGRTGRLWPGKGRG